MNDNIKKMIENFLPYQIDYTANFNKSFRREFQSQCVSPEIGADEFTILRLLDIEADVSQTDIAKVLFKGKAHIGKILNDMERNGYIKRVVDTKNNIMIKKNIMTEKALKQLELGKVKSKIIEDKMKSEFSKEEELQFISYLKRFRKVLDSIVDVKLK